jgi:two-component system nitrogen regulation response regulator GlnG
MGDPKKATLLIVDDDPDMRTLLSSDFRRQGYSVLEAAGGHEAFDKVLDGAIDLVVTDILMNDGTGFELIDRLRRLSPSCPPVVVVTGCTDLTAQELGTLGAWATFFKPYDRKELNTAVRTLIGVAG